MSTTLTKSRFKIALECPRKLNYATDKNYANAKSEDEFLQGLAEGGHQVGALAKLMYPGGIEITTPSVEEQIKNTQKLIEQNDVILYEPTFRHGNLVIRVDILVKRGNLIDLIEVKAKGFNSRESSFRGKNNPIKSEWRPYLYDVAYQLLVLERAHPEWTVTPHLMLLDTSVKSSIDGLGSSLTVTRDRGRLNVSIRDGFDISMQQPSLLRQHDVTDEVGILRSNPVETPAGEMDFVNLVDWLGDKLEAGETFPPYIGKQCKSCEFYCEPEQITLDNISGWAACMEEAYTPLKATWSRSDSVFGLYQFRKVDDLIANNILLMKDVDETQLTIKEKPGEISTSDRHLLQIMEARGEGDQIHLEMDTLRQVFGDWEYPLHFIDFETSRPALPFHSGCRPNDMILFQFSHHQLDADGQLRHANECLIATPGTWPNSSVVRALRDAVGNSGTVVHWWDHERTVLKEVKQQCIDRNEPDKDILCEFIDSLVNSESGRLADLGRLVSRTVFIKGTNGRSSIKKVLPAILAMSDSLEEHYGQPIYGTEAMPSLNYSPGWTWLREESGEIIDPYRLLDPIFLDDEVARAIDQAEDEYTGYDKFVANGGAAIIAYAQLQNPDLNQDERQRIEAQLKRYCELDTLAMVMIYEAISKWIK
ncbi:uncharacterized protein FOKN1_1343 [Thiohalobacter thiocyanaticus]|uniref:DUF2779 domain-containing protein n=1 Tax=Thiohalobacter thiocyanaticus TaxID=585455 RepID=A0A1Z4VQ50_9GAMM|nr:DUF2779 domain-containing protein [Thiohalobacter thiocyanaticus]BAZ93741.1 uncharacterized protein FOKN1_1343 [Thiohalobacter thiocyanaticus]